MALSVVSTPSCDQRRKSGLERANEVRIARAKLKHQLREGTVGVEQILAAPPEHISTAKVLDLLVTVPKVGPVKAARLLSTARISQLKTVGGLSDRQRTQLIELLRRRQTALPGATGEKPRADMTSPTGSHDQADRVDQ